MTEQPPGVGVPGDDPRADSGHPDQSGPVVVLVGVPGAGKSSVGAALAARLEVRFRDTDVDIESRTGRRIADIFVESGEPEFRRLEASAVAVAVAEHEGVLALGGGAVTEARTRALLAAQPVVWLRVGLAAAAARAGLGGPRPVLMGNIRSQLKGLMDARVGLYTEVASLIVDTDHLSIDESVEAICAGLALVPAGDPSGAPARDPQASGPPADAAAQGGAVDERPLEGPDD